jgi:transposase
MMHSSAVPDQPYFAGLDVHQLRIVVAVVDKQGVLVREASVRTAEPTRLVETLAPYHTAAHPLAVVVETCPFWPWLYDLLVPGGMRFHLAHAQELEAIAKAAHKRDERDAPLLARMLAGGLIPPAYPKPAAQREQACLVRHRAALVRHRTMLVNRVHSQLHAVGLALPREQLLRRATRTWLRETAGPVLRPEQRRLVASHWYLIRRLTRMVRRLDVVIAEAAAADPAAVLLATIPGIGAYRGLLLATELLPMTRYASEGKFVGYAGLAPITRCSAARVHRGPLPNAANRWVRGALISSIPTHLRCAPASPLSQYYARQKARLGWPIARVATARQLARVIYRMLRTGEAWRPTPGATPGPASASAASASAAVA